MKMEDGRKIARGINLKRRPRFFKTRSFQPLFRFVWRSKNSKIETNLRRILIYFVRGIKKKKKRLNSQEKFPRNFRLMVNIHLRLEDLHFSSLQNQNLSFPSKDIITPFSLKNFNYIVYIKNCKYKSYWSRGEQLSRDPENLIFVEEICAKRIRFQSWLQDCKKSL